MKKEKRDVPLKNYIIALLIVLGVVILTFYIKKTYDLSEERNLSQSILSRIIGEIKYDEIDNVFLEINGDYFIYISYSKNSEISAFEKQLKNLIVNNDLQNNFYYLNVNDEKKDDNLIKDLNNKFKLNNKKIDYIPAILYYENGDFKDLITSKKDQIITINDVSNLIKEMK